MLFKKMLRYVLTTSEAGARRPAIKCKFVVTNLLTSTNDNMIRPFINVLDENEFQNPLILSQESVILPSNLLYINMSNNHQFRFVFLEFVFSYILTSHLSTVSRIKLSNKSQKEDKTTIIWQNFTFRCPPRDLKTTIDIEQFRLKELMAICNV
jgi:hypothetical protein